MVNCIFPNIRVNVILLSPSRFFKWSPTRFLDSTSPYAGYRPNPAEPLVSSTLTAGLVDGIHVYKPQILRYVILKFLDVILLRNKYFPANFVFKPLSLKVQNHVLHPHTKPGNISIYIHTVTYTVFA